MDANYVGHLVSASLVVVARGSEAKVVISLWDFLLR